VRGIDMDLAEKEMGQKNIDTRCHIPMETTKDKTGTFDWREKFVLTCKINSDIINFSQEKDFKSIHEVVMAITAHRGNATASSDE
jgi:hypothetical protein